MGILALWRDSHAIAIYPYVISGILRTPPLDPPRGPYILLVNAIIHKRQKRLISNFMNTYNVMYKLANYELEFDLWCPKNAKDDS